MRHRSAPYTALLVLCAVVPVVVLVSRGRRGVGALQFAGRLIQVSAARAPNLRRACFVCSDGLCHTLTPRLQNVYDVPHGAHEAAQCRNDNYRDRHDLPERGGR